MLDRKDPSRRAVSGSSTWGLPDPQTFRLPLHPSSLLPRVAAPSSPPTQCRERTAGTELNRCHQQPPGKLGKVDTLIPVWSLGSRPLLLGGGLWAGGGQRPTEPSPSLADAMAMGQTARVRQLPLAWASITSQRPASSRPHRGWAGRRGRPPGWLGTIEVTPTPQTALPPAQPRPGLNSHLCK